MPLDLNLNSTTQTVLLRLPNGDPYLPMNHQRPFHESTAKFRAFIAGIGNGKSISCCMETIAAALLHPGSVNAVVRWDQSRLRDTTWRTLLAIIDASGLRPLVKRDVNSPQQSTIELEINGKISTIQGFHAKNWRSFGSLELSTAFLDECAECPDSDSWDQLCARLRHHIGPLRAWMCGLSDGHNWAWKQFVQEKLANHELFRGRTRDNPFLPVGYAEGLEQRYGKDRTLILLMGSFDSCEGRIFEMFSPQMHCVPRRQLPADWPRYTGIDPGWEDSTAMVRAAVDREGNILIESFYEKSHKTTEEWSREILTLNQNPAPMFYVIDPAADRNIGQGISVMDTARQGGISPIRPGNNDVGQSISRIRSLLTPDPNHPFPAWHKRAGEKGAPHLYFFEDLARLIWEMGHYRYKKQGGAAMMNNPQPHHDDADGISSLRYLLLEHLTEATESGPPSLNDFWQNLLSPPPERKPYLEQVSRLRWR